MLPETRQKDMKKEQLASLIATRDQLVKLRVSLLGKVHGMFVQHGLKIKREAITNRVGFKRHVNAHAWSQMEKIKLKVIQNQLNNLLENIKHLEKRNCSFCLPD